MSADSGSTSSSSTPEDADFNPAPPRRPRQTRPGSASKRVRQVESPESGDGIDDAGDSLMADAPAVAASDEAASRASSASRRSSGEPRRRTESKSPPPDVGGKHLSPETETEAVPDSEDGGDDEPTPLEAPAMVPSNSRQLSQSDLSELASSVKSLSPPVARRRARPARQTGPATASQGVSNGAGKSKASLVKSTGGRKAGGIASDMERTASRSTAASGGEEINDDDDDDDDVAERDQSESEEEPLGWGTTPAFRRRAAAALKQAPNSASKGKAVATAPKKRERVSESRSPGSSLTGATDSDEPDASAKPSAVAHGDDSGEGTSGGESSDSDAPDPAAFPTTKPSSNAMRGRGRPRGAKRGGGKPRSAVSVSGGHTSETTKKRGRGGSNAAAFKGRAKPPGSPFDAAGSPGVRATRATVTLPPGYIEGVKSARMTRVRSASSTPAPRATPQATAEPEELLEPEHEATLPQADPEPAPELDAPPTAQYQPQAIKGRKGFKGKEKELVKEEVVDVDLVMLVKEEDDPVSPPEPEAHEETPRAPTPLKEKGTPAKDKGKERAFTYEPERALSKRRKVDAEAVARSAERAAARIVLLEQLETEAQKIRDATHPLIEFTYDQLDAEKAVRLAQLAKSLEQQERDYDKILYADSQTVWRQWADAKDTLRTDMYLDNQEQLKQLIYEEKAYPFLRDHPLLVNTHGLPPVPFYRGPLSPEAAIVYPPRTDVYTGYTLEPPPLNHALDHDAWALSAGEIEDDMATLADYSASTIIPAPPLPRYPINPYAFYDGAQGPPPTAANGYRAPGYPPHPPPFYPPMATAPWPGAYDGSSGPGNPLSAQSSSSAQHAFPAMRTFDKAPPKPTQWSHSQLPSSTASTSAPARHSSSQPPPRHDAHSHHHAPPTSTAAPTSKSKPSYSAFGPPSASTGPPHSSTTAAVSPPVPHPLKASRPSSSTWYAIPGVSNNSYASGAGGAPPHASTVPASQKPSWAVDLPPRSDHRKDGGTYPYW